MPVLLTHGEGEKIVGVVYDSVARVICLAALEIISSSLDMGERRLNPTGALVILATMLPSWFV